MAEQVGVRAAARKAAAETRARLRAERAERERERDRLAETVIVHLAARDAAVVECERAAGAALERLVVGIGLTTAEVSQWCGGVSVREIGRLRQAARSPAGEAAS